MGKNYCKVDKKWCRFLKHNICSQVNCDLSAVNRCPLLKRIETKRLSDLLRESTFEEVSKALLRWFPKEIRSINGYRDVYNSLCSMTPRKHKYDDLFIEIKRENDLFGNEYLHNHGVSIIKREKITYGLELSPWIDWISMYITQDTLDSLTKEEIIASCLYEMTFYGFDEPTISDFKETLIDNIQKKDE